MRFIHLADVHLGAVPDRGCPWSKEREEERPGGFAIYIRRSVPPPAANERT